MISCFSPSKNIKNHPLLQLLQRAAYIPLGWIMTPKISPEQSCHKKHNASNFHSFSSFLNVSSVSRFGLAAERSGAARSTLLFETSIDSPLNTPRGLGRRFSSRDGVQQRAYGKSLCSAATGQVRISSAVVPAGTTRP